MFNRILYKYTSEAGYLEYISRRLLTSLQELPLIPFALRFLWSASHNVKEGDTCPFAISLIWSRYFLSYHTNAMRSMRNVLSWYLPLSLFPSLLRPLAVPRSPNTPPRAAFHLLWATLCIKAGIWVMYKSIWSVLLHMPHPAVQAGLECPGPSRMPPCAHMYGTLISTWYTMYWLHLAASSSMWPLSCSSTDDQHYQCAIQTSSGCIQCQSLHISTSSPEWGTACCCCWRGSQWVVCPWRLSSGSSRNHKGICPISHGSLSMNHSHCVFQCSLK